MTRLAIAFTDGTAPSSAVQADVSAAKIEIAPARAPALRSCAHWALQRAASLRSASSMAEMYPSRDPEMAHFSSPVGTSPDCRTASAGAVRGLGLGEGLNTGWVSFWQPLMITTRAINAQNRVTGPGV